jgi:omega-6 fatty acid desaturase (delta-12 desaturase)
MSATSANLSLLPSPKEVRALVSSEARRQRSLPAIAMTVGYVLTYLAGYALFCVPFWPVRIAGTLLLGIMGAKFFELGHEALHLHFTGSRRLDQAIAHLTMVVPLMPLAPTTYHHSRRHHLYTNVKGYDTQWSPHTPAEYRAMRPLRRTLERLYRSGLGLGLYWTIDIVGYVLWYGGDILPPSAQLTPPNTRAFLRDRIVVWAWTALQLAGWMFAAPYLHLSRAAACVGGFVVPVLISHYLIGAVTYFQHVAEDVPWTEDPAKAPFFQAQVQGSHALIPSSWLMALLVKRARPHAAHHVDMSIPAYGLATAQAAIDEAYPGATPARVLTLRAIRTTLATCKLYDFDADCWVDFEGKQAGARP